MKTPIKKVRVPATKELDEDGQVERYLYKMSRAIARARLKTAFQPSSLRIRQLAIVLKSPARHPPLALTGLALDHQATELGVMLSAIKDAIIYHKEVLPDGVTEEWGEWNWIMKTRTIAQLTNFAEKYASRPSPGIPFETTPALHDNALRDSLVTNISADLLRLVEDDDVVPEQNPKSDAPIKSK